MPVKNPVLALASNVGGLTGLLVLLNRMWDTAAPLEDTLMTAFGAGMAVYLVLMLGCVGVRYVASLAPPEDAAEDDAAEETGADAPDDAAPASSKAPPEPAPAS